MNIHLPNVCKCFKAAPSTAAYLNSINTQFNKLQNKNEAVKAIATLGLGILSVAALPTTISLDISYSVTYGIAKGFALTAKAIGFVAKKAGIISFNAVKAVGRTSARSTKAIARAIATLTSKAIFWKRAKPLTRKQRLIRFAKKAAPLTGAAVGVASLAFGSFMYREPLKALGLTALKAIEARLIF